MKYLGSGILVVALMLGLVAIAQASHHRRGATAGCASCGTQAPVQAYGCQGGAPVQVVPQAAPIYSGGCQGGSYQQPIYGGGCVGSAPTANGCAGGRVGLFHRHR